MIGTVVQWQQVLDNKLDQCGVFVVLIGQLGVSGGVSAEVSRALNRHFSRGAHQPRPIVPVLLGDTPEDQVPPFLSLFQCHHLAQADDPAAAAGLAEAIQWFDKARTADDGSVTLGDIDRILGCGKTAKRWAIRGKTNCTSSQRARSASGCCAQ